jgi:hypothetical protein
LRTRDPHARPPSGVGYDRHGMGSRRTKLVIVLAAVVVVAVAAGLAVWLTTGNDDNGPQLTHRDYAALFGSAVVHQTKISFLERWPKPYQTYHDSYKHQCYEWWDKPIALYSLCFKDGTLVNKDLL